MGGPPSSDLVKWQREEDGEREKIILPLAVSEKYNQ
jgi:hypothetical protein